MNRLKTGIAAATFVAYCVTACHVPPEHDDRLEEHPVRAFDVGHAYTSALTACGTQAELFPVT
jgi:hypothetical protein